jgi:hypothetical protein
MKKFDLFILVIACCAIVCALILQQKMDAQRQEIITLKNKVEYQKDSLRFSEIKTKRKQVFRR